MRFLGRAGLLAQALSAMISVQSRAEDDSAADAKRHNLLDDLRPGHWLEIPNSKMKAAIYDGPLAGQVYAVTGPASIIGAWGGGTLDTKQHRLLLWGGGHQNYAGNDLYAFEVDTLRWVRVTDPSPIAGYDGKSGVLADGTPVSRHTYGGLAYLPKLNRLFANSGSNWPDGGYDKHTWLFDFARNQWHRGADSPSLGYGNIAAYDPANGHVWVVSGGTGGFLSDYDPVADKWTARGSGASAPINIYSSGAIDPTHHALVAIGHGQIFRWSLGEFVSINYATPRTSGDLKAQEANSPGFVWYPPSQAFVAWAGGTELYMLDPVAWKWTMHKPAGDNKTTPMPPTKVGTFGRFQYVPSRGVFILVNDMDQNVYAYKPDFDDPSSKPSR